LRLLIFVGQAFVHGDGAEWQQSFSVETSVDDQSLTHFVNPRWSLMPVS
jgi:hypothetical protein